jgi:hypothetical protein
MVEVTYFSQFQGNSDGPYAFLSALYYIDVINVWTAESFIRIYL